MSAPEATPAVEGGSLPTPSGEETLDASWASGIAPDGRPIKNPNQEPSAAGVISACYATGNGAIRMINAGAGCRTGERRLTWDQGVKKPVDKGKMLISGSANMTPSAMERNTESSVTVRYPGIAQMYKEYIDRITQISSITDARFGIISLTSIPLSPRGRN
jgi:hypothetical protein